MDAKDVLELVRAGFTKDEIARMFGGQQQENKPVEQKENKPVEQKEEKPVEQPPDKAEVRNPLEMKMDKLLDAIASSNFFGANQPAQKTVEEISDDFIASIINPNEGVNSNGSK